MSLRGFLRYISLFAVFTLFLWMFTVIFLPKKAMLNELDYRAQNKGYGIDIKSVSDYGLWFASQDISILMGTQPSVKIESATSMPAGIVNISKIDSLKLDGQYASMLPWAINGYIVHTIFEPYTIRLYGSGDFGSLRAAINVKNKHIKLFIKPSDAAKSNIPMNLFVQQDDGLVYETNY